MKPVTRLDEGFGSSKSSPLLLAHTWKRVFMLSDDPAAAAARGAPCVASDNEIKR